mmetsp:Transcript_45276/g.73452  ORF Transcript_45276/g.73452 Transcript_45276/m.73452 type:complete len:251 (+) Transcript_45276:64-816(+)
MAQFHVVDTRHMLQGTPGVEIIGDDQQMLHITLKPGQSCWAEPGCMIHCDMSVKSIVDAGTGGCFGVIKRVFLAGDSLFRVHWTNTDNTSDKVVGLGANFPAKVVPVNLDEWHGEVFVKRHAFLAAMDPQIQFNIERAGRQSGGTISKGALAGQGFILNKINGRGWIFLNAAGSILEKTLRADETIVVDRQCVVAWQTTCQFGFRWVGGIGMMCCGGEGLTDTTLTGPGKVILQSMPFEKTKALYTQPQQ